MDMDCQDDLICDRSSAHCAVPAAALAWDSPQHDVNGACDTDADCPIGQRCDTQYNVPASGPYVPEYFPTVDAGRHLCVLPEGTTPEVACPRAVTTADLAGARFVTGKEICVRGQILVDVEANDRDTHVQMVVEEPLPYPKATAPYNIFGATNENGPPYKDPARPQGALPDPRVGDRVMTIGTYRYDGSHGWFEVHPIKAWWPSK
jgi:hypothetical protein